MRSNSCEIMNSIAKGMNAILSKDGLVVFGENEDRQGIDKNLIFDIMTKNGFEPIYLHDDKGKNNVNVWRKISENVINQSS